MNMKRILSLLLCMLLALTSVSITAMAQTEPVVVNLLKGDTYTLPTDINWDEDYSVDTTKVGYQLFTGRDADDAAVTYRINVGEWKVLMEENFDSYDIAADGQAAFTKRAVTGGTFTKNAYTEGSFGAQIVKDGTNGVLSFGPDSSSWVGCSFVPATNLKDDFKVSFKARVAEFDAEYSTEKGSHLLLGMNFNNTNVFHLRLYKDSETTVSMSNIAYVNQGKGVNIPTDEIAIVAGGDGKVSTEWAEFDIVARNGAHSMYVGDTALFENEAWHNTGVTDSGITAINIAKAQSAEKAPGTAYLDNLTYSQAVYPTGDVPTNLTAKMETGADGSGSVNFNLAMSDNTTKTYTANFTADTSQQGTSVAQAVVDGFNFTIPVSVTVEDAPLIVESVECETSKTVFVGDEFTLPATVTAAMSDATTEQRAITWNAAASTESRGVYTFTGTVADYSGTVTYTLTVVAAVKASDIAAKNSVYKLPEKYNGEEIDWGSQSLTVDTTYVGKQVFTGMLPGDSQLIFTVNVGESNVVFTEDMESYTVGGENPDYGDREEYGDDGGLYLGDKCSIVYENGESGNKIAKINESSEWGQFDMIAPNHATKNYIITGRFKTDDNQPMGSLTRFIVYNEAVPQQEVCGMYINISTPGILRVGNSANISVSAGANPDAYSTQEKTFENYNGEWVDFRIVVDMTNKNYDIYANGHEIRMDCPLNLNGLTNASFKTIRIKRYGTTNPISFDDIKVTEYVWVDDILPASLTDSVVSGVDADRTQSISLKMSDGTTRQFDVEYTFDPTQSGVQNVTGTIDGFSETIPVAIDVDAREIVSIKAESLSNGETVYTGSNYVLPATVVAVMSEELDGSNEKEMNVEWDGVADTSEEGEYTFNGTVSGYSGDIVFTLTISDDKPVSVSPITVTKSLNEAYSLPKTVTVNMESGETNELEVNWNGAAARTDKAGTFTYSGYVIGYPAIGDDPGIPVSVTLTVETSAVKAVNYEDGKGALDIVLEENSNLPAKVVCEYENGMFGFEEVVWNTEGIGNGYGPYTVTGTLTNDNLADGFDGSVNASVSYYAVPSPAMEDGLDTHKYDVPYGDFKFPLGVSLKYAQYPSNNMASFMCVEDPTNSANKVIRYENRPEANENNKMQYSGLDMITAKTGMLVAKTKMYLPIEFTQVTFRILTGMHTQLCQFELNGDRSIKPTGASAVANAFPLDEWFEVTLVTDTTTQEASERYYDLYINGVYLMTAPWYMAPSETNGVGTSGVRYIDWRNDDDATFVMYLDDVKLYFLNDLMEDAYTAVNDVETVIQSDSVTLPSGAGGTAITWASSEESVITSAGAVTRPAYNEANKNVTLTAAMTKTAGCFTAKDSVDVSVKVMKVGATDGDLISEAISALSLPAETSSDLTLRTSFGKAEIIWTTGNSSIIDEQGRVYPVDADTNVTMTATVKCGSETGTRTFTVKVLHTEELTDIQKVRKAMNSVTLPSETSTSLELPTNVDGVTVTWVSKNLSVITSSGALVSNRTSTADATLTAAFICGDAYQTKDYIVTVQKSSNSNVSVEDSGGSSGGGGGGSKSSYVQTAPTVNEIPTVADGKFTDLAGYEWAKEAIEALSDKGIINGVGNNAFAPSSNIKREEFAAMIVRLAKIESAEIENPFSDVTENDWFMKELNTAYANGIINGMGDGTFGAGRNITRQDMAVILFNLAKRYGIDTANAPKPVFNDYSNISEYAIEAVDFLSSKGIINGTEGNMLPQRMATRAEAAKMIYEFIKALDIENLSLDKTVTEDIISNEEGAVAEADAAAATEEK